MFPGYVSELYETDPEFIEIFDNFAFDEVVNHEELMKNCAAYQEIAESQLSKEEIENV